MKLSLLSRLKTRRGLAWTLSPLIVLLLIVAFITVKQGRQAEASTTRPIAALELLPSDVAYAKQGELRRILPLTGSLRAVNQAVIKAKVNGDVREVLVREGEAVKTGQILIRMDTSEYDARALQAKGGLQAAQGQLDIATQTRNNNKALLEKNFISRNAFDNAQSQYAIAISNVKTARGVFDVAQKALNDTIIRAPVSGFISSRTVQPGEKVSADNRLLEIVDLRQMEMEAPVPAADVVSIKAGQEVEVRVEGLPKPLIGKVARINPSIQAGSRSIMVYIRIGNEDGVVRMGMFGEAKLTLAKKADALLVPESAVQVENGESIVYAIEDGKIVKKTVKVGMRGEDGHENAIEIIDGLSPGARILRANLGNLQNGSSVRIAEAKQAANTTTNPEK